MRKVTRRRSQESGGDARRRVESDIDGCVGSDVSIVLLVSIVSWFTPADISGSCSCRDFSGVDGE